MSTQVTRSRLGEWIDPRSYPVLGDVKDFVGNSSGVKDAMDGVITVCDWVNYFEHDDRGVAAALEPIKSTLAVPQFIENCGKMRERWRILWQADNTQEAAIDFTSSVAATTTSFCESVIAGNSWGVYSLKEGLQAARTAFWSSIAVGDAIYFFDKINQVSNLQERIENVSGAAQKNILNHRIQLGYLNILRSVTMLAMCLISLTSLVFASLAQGFLFSPVVFLTLSSAWLILRYGTHFYKRWIDRLESNEKKNQTVLVKA